MLKASVRMFTSLIEHFENSPLRQTSVNISACRPDKDKMKFGKSSVPKFGYIFRLESLNICKEYSQESVGHFVYLRLNPSIHLTKSPLPSRQ
jgi:hypothetical protein